MDEKEVNEKEECIASRSRRGAREEERRRETKRVVSRRDTAPRTRAQATRAECAFEVVADLATSLI